MKGVIDRRETPLGVHGKEPARIVRVQNRLIGIRDQLIFPCVGRESAVGADRQNAIEGLHRFGRAVVERWIDVDHYAAKAGIASLNDIA